MYASYSIVNPLTLVRVTRRLPRQGSVLVRPGDAVEPTQIVAQTTDLPDFRIVDVAQELDVPVKKVSAYLKVKRGDTVSEGDVLAARVGIGRRACRAPISGTIVGSGRGRLLIEGEDVVIRLNALVPGYVVDAWPDEGVVIETAGGHIQGVWGNGQEAYGVLRLLVRSPRHPIRSKHINASSQGAILIGGSTIDQDAIEEAVEMQVRGIIVGSVPPALIPRLQEVSFPVIATECVGAMPMSEAVFDLLKSWDGRDAALSGQLGGRWRAERPYIVVPMPTGAAKPVDTEKPLEVGDRVRILRGRYQTRSGVVVEKPRGTVELETGARMAGVLVDIGEEDEVPIPYENLERLL
ncbi:MAG: hypothetical protein ACP5JG_02815 [Anaerolineae bacterium]